jgi:hypothetical protein
MALALVASAASAHPHLRKTVEASLAGDTKATISYVTVPANMDLAKAVEVGAFASPGGTKFTLSADVTAGETTIAAGDYTLGVVRKGEAEWVVALSPGAPARGVTPDPSKLIELTSEFTSSAGSSDHMLVDVTPGSGSLEGRVGLTIHYGPLFVAGLLQ